MSAVRLQTDGLVTGYAPGIPALRDITFTATGGQIVAVLGPNGGGKTTLMRALLGELPVLAGTLTCNAPIAYVPQTNAASLDFPISAFDVALMGAYGRTPWWRRVLQTDRDCAREALRRVGLLDRADTRFGTLSGGQRQRVLIARALVQNAPILLLDEPFSGVDRASEAMIMTVLDELRGEQRLLLLCTHDIAQGRAMDRILALNGAQTYFGPGDEIDADALRRTYGAELVERPDGTLVAVGHHHH